jgi:hypothetical protein
MSHLVLLPSLYEVACLGNGGRGSLHIGEKRMAGSVLREGRYQRLVEKDYNCMLIVYIFSICELGVLFTVVLRCKCCSVSEHTTVAVVCMITLRNTCTEAEFLDIIGTKVLRVFLLAIHSLLY